VCKGTGLVCSDTSQQGNFLDLLSFLPLLNKKTNSYDNIFRKMFGKTERKHYLCTKFNNMRVVSFSMIREFIAKHADADVPLRDWYKRTSKANWTCLADIKKTFNTVDYVGNDRYVFDIKGNNYRIVAIVLFINKKVYMRFVGTHEEYNRIKDIKNI
jgi:mRNA interferase HigB